MPEYFIAYSKISHFNIISTIHNSNMEYWGGPQVDCPWGQNELTK
jgi:hypothetical protein